ncbi:hypothetical protein C8F01DRAFT_1380301, partial [Mycena amicta]
AAVFPGPSLDSSAFRWVFLDAATFPRASHWVPRPPRYCFPVSRDYPVSAPVSLRFHAQLAGLFCTCSTQLCTYCVVACSSTQISLRGAVIQRPARSCQRRRNGAVSGKHCDSERSRGLCRRWARRPGTVSGQTYSGDGCRYTCNSSRLAIRGVGSFVLIQR